MKTNAKNNRALPQKLIWMAWAILAGSTPLMAGPANAFFMGKLSEADGRFSYAYPPSSSCTVDSKNAHDGKPSLRIVLDCSTYSGAAAGISPALDLTKIRETGVLRFWVKGAEGGEKCSIALCDGEDDGAKVENRLPLGKYTKVSTDWQQVEIPLKDFGDQGFFWDGSREQKLDFDWSRVAEFKVFTAPSKGGGPNMTLYMSEVRVE